MDKQSFNHDREKMGMKKKMKMFERLVLFMMIKLCNTVLSSSSLN